MGLFEDVVVGTKAAVSSAGRAAGKFVDISKLRINSAEIHSRISKKLEQLGEITYKEFKNGTKELPDDLKPLISEINNLSEEFQEVQKKIAIIKNKLKCKKCSFENEQGSIYCTKCGEKL